MRAAIFLAVTLLTACNDAAKPCVPTGPSAAVRVRLRADSYECTKEEVGLMERYYKTCMDGIGYTSSYCLDRAVLATCHRADATGGRKGNDE